MLGDYFTKPLQGSLFHRYRKILMGYEHISSSLTKAPNIANKERVEKSVFANSEQGKLINKGVRFEDPPHRYMTEQTTQMQMHQNQSNDKED